MIQVSAAYDFTRSGAGDYSIKPSNLFTYVDGDGTPKGLYATVEHIAKVKLSGDFVVPRHVRSKRAFVGCSDTQQMVVEAAIEAAKHRVEKSLIYLDSISAPTARYETWFGEYDEGRKETVRSSFQKMLQVADFSSLTYDCTCPDPSKPITIAYVCKRGFQLWDYCPVSDEALDQQKKVEETEKCTSAVASGDSQSPAPRPSTGRLSMSHPTSGSTAAPKTSVMVDPGAWSWPPWIPSSPSKMLTVCGSSLRTILICIDVYRYY